MPVTEYLQRARLCADEAERMDGAEKVKMLQQAREWLKLAEQAAEQATKQQSKSRTVGS